MKLLTSLRLELAKIFLQRGTYVGHGILAVVLLLMIYGLWRYGPERSVRRSFRNDMVVGGKVVSGLSPVRGVMEPALFILVPMLVAAVSGALVAGEARSGVLRAWLCRPVTRLTLLTAKQLAAWVHAASLTVFLGAFALLLGYLFFGGGDLVDMRGGDGMVIFDERLGLLRLALAYGLAAVVMCALASLALLCSVLLENPMVAAAAAVASLPVSQILVTIEYFKPVKPYLLVTYLDIWRHVFRAELRLSDFLPGMYYVGAYCLVPFVIAAVIFWRKDITS